MELAAAKQIVGSCRRLSLKRIILRTLFQVPSKTNTTRVREPEASCRRSATVSFARLTAWRLGKSNMGRITGIGDLAIDLRMLGEIYTLEPERIAKPQMRHPTGAKPVLGLARLAEYHKARQRVERFDERTVASHAGPPATRTPGTELGRIGQSIHSILLVAV